MKDLSELQGFLLKDDPLYRECIRLATNSGSDEIRFGSILVKDNKILGRGWNKLARKKENLPIVMGYANHAEVQAMNDALSNGYNLRESQIYVAGYFTEDGVLYIPSKASFTCTRCPIYFERYRINEIYVPSYSAWKKLYLDEAKKTAQLFWRNSRNMRTRIGKSNFTLDSIGL